MQVNTLTARYCGLSPVRIQEALFIGRSLERCRKFQEFVDEIQKKGYNNPELFTDEPVDVYTLQEGNTTTMMEEDIQSESDKRKQDISDDLLMDEDEWSKETLDALYKFAERSLLEGGPVRFPE